VVGAAALSWVDVVRRTYGTRRQLHEVLIGDEELALVAPPEPVEQGPEQRAEQLAALDGALSALAPQERFVVLAKYQYGLSYREIARRLFDTPEGEKRVDRILQRARKKLANAEARWRAMDDT
jgi:RNA polymerase sigma factor (sigma-70 family)